MDFKTVRGNDGFAWVGGGWALFRKAPAMWVVQFIISTAILLVLSFVPLIGSFATLVLQPVFLGGMLLGYRILQNGEDLRIGHLFSCFRQNTKPLVMIGFYTGLGYLAVGLVAAMFIGGGAMGLGILGEVLDNPELADDAALAGALLIGLLASLAALPILMAAWFAPALVVFDDLAPLDAMKTSFYACLANIAPFSLYGLMVLPLLLLAAISAGLGLLVLAPVLVGSVYISYRDIFDDRDY